MGFTTAILIGSPDACLLLEQQLNLLPDRPITIGWVLADENDLAHCEPGDPVLGWIGQLEAIFARRAPQLALVTLPAAYADQVQSIRTRLRKLGIADRYMPPLRDQLAGVGPRSMLTIDLNDLLDRPPRSVDEDAVRTLVENCCVLITGAGGSIGSELARMVARYRPATLALVERSENALFEIDRQIARSHPELARRTLLHDVVDAEATRELFTAVQPQVIFHAAAHKHVPMMEDHPAAAIDNNVFGTKSVADAAVACGAERCVLISSDKAVNPTSVMGATKRLAECYIQTLHPTVDTGFSMVRFGNVLGSAGSVIETWSRQIAEGGPMTVTDPRMTRYFMTIPEAASLVVQAAALSDPTAEEAEVFVLNMGDPVSIVELASRFASLHGLSPRLRDESNEDTSKVSGFINIVYTGVRPGEKLHEELARPTDVLSPTRHSDIDIWWVKSPDPLHVEACLRQLDPARRPAPADTLITLIHELVVEPAPLIAA